MFLVLWLRGGVGMEVVGRTPEDLTAGVTEGV
jgi:hypothetical protein